MTALGRANRVGAARVRRRWRQCVVGAFAVCAADRVDRREIQHVEPHRAHPRQMPFDIGESAVAVGIIAHGAREHFVPGREGGAAALGIDADRAGQGGCPRTVIGGCHLGGQVGGEQDRLLLGRSGSNEVLEDRLQCRNAGRRAGDEVHALADFQRDVQPGLYFLLQLVAISREHVPPGFDSVFIGADPLEREVRAEAVIAQRPHGRLGPSRLARAAPVQHGGQRIMAIADHVGRHRDHFAHNPLGGVGAIIDTGRRRLDGDAGAGGEGLHGGRDQRAVRDHCAAGGSIQTVFSGFQRYGRARCQGWTAIVWGEWVETTVDIG